jgi:hypothetical protein
VIIDDADRPAVEGGVYSISYVELVDGYRHAFWNPDRRKVCYSRTFAHPEDPRCPECAEAKR